MKTDKAVSRAIINWYAANHRELPWRETVDPYRIWISEIILQQTRVAQGLEYYRRFTARFPDIAKLANASEDEVLKYWQGLGYYSRARNLLTAAREIKNRFGGIFPKKYEDVRSLKGIGDYTAAAVCSIAFGLPHAVVDGNVYRVLARLSASDIPTDTSAGKKHFAALAADLLDPDRPGLHNQAVMELGALQCVPQTPDCSLCPVAGHCQALRHGTVATLPVKQGKAKVVPRYFHYFHILHDGKTFLSRRNAKDIWQGLYEFPVIETEGPEPPDRIFASPAFRELFSEADEIRLQQVTDMPRHQLSHRTIHARFYKIISDQPPRASEGYVAVDPSKIDDYAVSRLTESYLELRSRKAERETGE